RRAKRRARAVERRGGCRRWARALKNRRPKFLRRLPKQNQLPRTRQRNHRKKLLPNNHRRRNPQRQKPEGLRQHHGLRAGALHALPVRSRRNPQRLHRQGLSPERRRKKYPAEGKRNPALLPPKKLRRRRKP